jgi:hypothetical protein
MIKPGIYRDLSNEDYHADKNSISRSSLRDFHRNPYYYWAMHLNPNRPIQQPTDAMILGEAFHTFILEPHIFDNSYAVEPAKVFLKDVGREQYDYYKSQCEELANSNKKIISHEDLQTLTNMSISLSRDSRFTELLTNSEIEKSLFWEDKGSGLIVKARPDVLQENMIIDLKTIADASAHSFQRSMIDGWYHVQGAMIRDAIRTLENRDISNVINICIEKKYPYCVGIYIIDEVALDYGEKLYKNILLDMKSCILNNNFSDYEIKTIGLPAWATN